MADETEVKCSKEAILSVDDIWPQERDFMERPERYKYVRKIVNPGKCVFCSASDVEPSFESLCLYQNSKVLVLLNKYPYNSGHLLVIPRRHVGSLIELDMDTYSSLSMLLKLTMKIIEEAYECAGMNIGLNHGKVAGAGIPDHLHWHIIPRWLGDTNFFPIIAETKALPETLEQAYARLKPKFEELSDDI